MAFSESNASDDISLFLRQLLQRSSSPRPSPVPHLPSFPLLGPSSSLPSAPPHLAAVKNPAQSSGFISSSTVPLPVTGGEVVHSGVLDGYYHQQVPSQSMSFSGSDRVSHSLEHSPFATAGSSFSDRYFQSVRVGGSDYSSVPVTALESETVTADGSVLMKSMENEAEDHDYESEEGADAMMEGGVQGQQNPTRSSSKRSRAAEVHNLSEKRRRSKINEKMKALQNLIPNSNKTDKASMLDEAIEYLKQLQLQVQMLSIRNGLSLHPMCLPGVSGLLHPSQLSQLGITFDSSSRDVGPSFLPNGETTAGPPLDQTQHQYDPSSTTMAATTVPSSSSLRGMINTDSSFAAIDSSSSSPNQLASFTLPTHHQDAIREDISYQKSIINHSQPDRLEFKTGMMMPILPPTTTSNNFGPHHQSSDSRDQQGSAAADQHVHHLLASCSR